MLILIIRRGTLPARHVVQVCAGPECIQVSLTRVVAEALPSLLISGWPRVHTHSPPGIHARTHCRLHLRTQHCSSLTPACLGQENPPGSWSSPGSATSNTWLTWFSSAVLQGTKHTKEVAQCPDTYWFTSLCTSTSRAHLRGVNSIHTHTRSMRLIPQGNWTIYKNAEMSSRDLKKNVVLSSLL